ncbi:MAG: SdpI family protein [Candidatus Bathyarchaeia archaeon]
MVFCGFISYWMGKTRNVNRWIGFRTRSTLSNVDVWEAINKGSGIAFMVEGIGIILASIVFRDLVVANYLAFIMLAMVVLLSIVIKYAYYASNMAERLSKPEPPQ